METTFNPQDIAALWFTGFFLSLICYYACKGIWNLPRKNYDVDGE